MGKYAPIYMAGYDGTDLAVLTLSDATFAAADAVGVTIGNIVGKTDGSTLSYYDPDENDYVSIDVLALKVAAGGAAASAGTIDIVIRETHPNSDPSYRDTPFTLTITA